MFTKVTIKPDRTKYISNMVQALFDNLGDKAIENEFYANC